MGKGLNICGEGNAGWVLVTCQGRRVVKAVVWVQTVYLLAGGWFVWVIAVGIKVKKLVAGSG